MAFHTALRAKRKTAVRLGECILDQAHWAITREGIKKLRRNAPLEDDDFRPAIRQKGVDMRMGIDIVSVVLKRQANLIFS